MHRLVTIGISHYCEKARWALDHAAVPYIEAPHLPIFHRVAARRAAKVKQLPVFLPEGGPPVTDSTDILVWADTQLAPERRLFPDDREAGPEVRRLEAHFDQALGPPTRLAIFGHVIPELRRHIGGTAVGEPAYERALLRASLPIAKGLLRRLYTINPKTVAIAMTEIDTVFAEVTDRLADGRTYLVGDRFSAADLTFAALAGPAINRSFRGPIIADERLPETLAPHVARWRETPAGEYATRIYDDHRGGPVP